MDQDDDQDDDLGLLEHAAFDLGRADPRMRAFVVAYALTGSIIRACKAARVSHMTTRTPQWREDPEFQRAMGLAEEVIAERMEAEARRRATEGTRSYKFTKEGVPLRHPEECECGHGIGVHARGKVDGVEARTSCTECSCTRFLGAFYFEHAYSDRLLEFVLKAQSPEKYGDRLQVRGLLGSLDISKLPDDVVQRIADGGDPMEVLVNAARAGVKLLTAGPLARREDAGA